MTSRSTRGSGNAPHARQEEQPTTQMPPEIPEIANLEDITAAEPEPEASSPALEPEPEAPPPALEPEPEAPPPALEPEQEAPPPALEPEPGGTAASIGARTGGPTASIGARWNPTEEKSPQDSESIEMKPSCSSCSASFKVKIPPGAPGVRVPCPCLRLHRGCPPTVT